MILYLLPVSMLVGAICHELVHALAAVLVGGSVDRINLWDLYVDFRAPTERREWLVLNGPALLGLLLLPVVLWFVSDWREAIVLLSGWGALSLMGGKDEIGMQRLLKSLNILTSSYPPLQ